MRANGGIKNRRIENQVYNGGPVPIKCNQTVESVTDICLNWSPSYMHYGRDTGNDFFVPQF